MPYFCISVTLLDALFHGKGDRDEPEWPPSPLRLFQALLAGVRAGCGNRRWSAAKAEAFHWLEKQGPPRIVAPSVSRASSYVRFVPSNDGDRQFDRQERLSAKVFWPHRPSREDQLTLHYLWPLTAPLSDDVRIHAESVADLVHKIVALGLGVDVVVAHGAIMSVEQANALPGEQWLPSPDAAGRGLRVPKQGTLDDLIYRHERFLKRLGADGFTVPPPLSVYDNVAYRRATDPRIRPVAAFSLLKLDAGGFRAFDTARRALTVAGMTRHVARAAARTAGWDELRINAFILGHGDSKDTAEHVAVGPRRFAYLPLPTIEARGEGRARAVGSIRRVMLSSFAEDCDAEIAWARRALSGRELVDESKQQPVALLSLIPENEKVVRHYTQPAASWATVTPVVLPGHDDPAHYRRRLKRGTSAEEQKQLLDRLDERIDGLLRKAITQGGVAEVLADHAELQWRKVGFWPGTDLADRYGVPDHLRRFPCLHVRLHWRDAQGRPVQVPGPVCFGSGRFYGLDLFAAL